MIISQKNPGKYIPYTVTGNNIMFNDEIMINLSKYERDEPVHIDICYDKFKNLVVGATAGQLYVAQVDIPARRYTETTIKQTETKGGDGSSELSFETVPGQPVPFNMDITTLTLWAING